MVLFKIKTNTLEEKLDLGERICESLTGCKAFIESDIVVNYDDDPEYIYIFLGDDSVPINVEITSVNHIVRPN